jgi:hypothetical protein
MKTAKYSVVTVDILCPYCEGETYAPCGGVAWEVIEIESGAIVHCENGHQFKLPTIKN